MQARATFDPANELQRSAELLFRHWTITLPSALASMGVVAVVFIALFSTIVAFFAGTVAIHGNAGVATGVGSGLGIGLFCLFVAFMGLGFAVAMTLWGAQDVLQDRDPNLSVAASAATARYGQFALLGIISIAAALIPLALCVVLIGIPMLMVLGYFLMYAPAAVIVGGESATTAIATSIRIARERVGESLVACIGIFICGILGMMANATLGHIPFVNLAVGFFIGGFTTAYSEIVRTRFYLALRIPGVETTMSAPPPPVSPVAYVAPPAPQPPAVVQPPPNG